MEIKKTALLTGGAGFIGSNLANRLIEDKWKVCIVDNLSTGYIHNIPKQAEFLELDVTNPTFIDSLSDYNYDVVFHLAAQSSGEVSFDDPLYDLKTNCASTVMLLDYCLKKGIKRFIYTSSMSIYGEQKELPVSEDSKAKPLSFYGVGKLASESYMDVYNNMGINTTALRLFNVYGPGQNLTNLKQGMVSIYMAYLLKGQEIIVKGSLERFRDFIYIDDIVQAIMECISNNQTYGKKYNIGTGYKTTVADLIDAEIVSFGYKPDEYPVVVQEGTPGDQFGIIADNRQFYNDVGWYPKVSLKDGLFKMVSWAKGQINR